MIIKVEVGELQVRTDGERVNLITHAGDGPSVCLSLSPLAAHNLGVVLPDYVQEAAGAAIGNIVGEMRRGPATACDECGRPIPDSEPDMISAHHHESCSLHPGNTA
jgi:hypothetical protein